MAMQSRLDGELLWSCLQALCNIACLVVSPGKEMASMVRVASAAFSCDWSRYEFSWERVACSWAITAQVSLLAGLFWFGQAHLCGASSGDTPVRLRDER